MQVHPTAIIQEGARAGEGCVIHAHALVPLSVYLAGIH